jgi:signal transduction histidine kinase
MRGEAGDVATASAGGLSAAFGADVEPIAQDWPDELHDADPATPAVPPAQARAITKALGAALAGDLAMLAARLGLDAGADVQEIPGRLDAALRCVDAMRLVALRRPSLRAQCSAELIDAGFAAVARGLAVQAAATIAAKAGAAEGQATSGSAAMAVTMHELRRPLTVLSGYSQLLGRGMLGELSERGRSAAQAMIGACEVMLRLTDALAEVARLEDPAHPMELAEVDIADVIDGAAADAGTEAELHEVGISTEVARPLRVRGDRERLTVALTNLLSNAVKHSPRGAVVEVGGFGERGWVHVVVRDHGPGFPPQTAGRLFERYYRDAGERERGIPGTGLGLFIVQTVAERHRGRAVARLARGGGAEFELIIPALPPA